MYIVILSIDASWSLLRYFRASGIFDWLSHLAFTYLYEIVWIEANASRLKQNAMANRASLRVKAVKQLLGKSVCIDLCNILQTLICLRELLFANATLLAAISWSVIT